MEGTVYFRAFEEEDAELIYNWMNDDELKRLSVGVNRRMCRDEALDWVKARMRDNRNQVFWAICSKNENVLIGYTFITNIHYINRTAEFGGIVIGDSNYHNGLAWIESYIFVLDYVFDRLNINRFSDTAITENLQSNKIADVFFFQKEGVLREAVYKNGRFYDLSLMSILQKDYREHKSAGDYDIKRIIRRFSSK